ncbi:peptidoglycan-binding protein [Curtobacterium ammoniigenes]|uniref:peptidoglycan-binding protein n=1 Tax=Curtobacterium ammoniigenes TaxID=395387 RepID=UPI00082D3817|nr:peptidoglycan-binding protein [Curtobacterium ammoniigenes]
MRRRTIGIAAIAALVAIGGGAGAIGLVGDPATRTAPSATAPRASTTAKVERADLSEIKRLVGSLGYEQPVAVTSGTPGTVTWLPKPGTVLQRDQPAFAIDEQPVRSMHGAVPVWRTIAPGMRGADVRQLNENLSALGYDVAVDSVYGPRTGRAVRQWQHERGLDQTGRLGADSIVFLPGDVRVASVSAKLGGASGGEMLRVTGTGRVVTANVSAADADRLGIGTSVALDILGVGEFEGTVVDTAPREGAAGAEEVVIVVAFDPGESELPPSGGARLEVRGVTKSNVLTVPLAAIVAGSRQDDFAVERREPTGGTHRVAVHVTFVADGRAAVEGDLAEGDTVVVPS